MAPRVLACFVFSCVVIPAATAQFVGPGLTWSGSSGAAAGSFLPSCTNYPVTAHRGEAITVRVWGDPQAPFALLAATSGNHCLAFPGLGNALILDPPLFVVGAGVLTETSPCLSCPPGLEELHFKIPFAVPPAASLSLQALSLGAGRPGFTVAVTGTVI